MTRIEQSHCTDVWLADRGCWRSAVRDGIRTASVSCPRCGEVVSINVEGLGLD